MLIGWTGIAGVVIAVIGILSIPVISPLIINLTGSIFVDIPIEKIFFTLLLFILTPVRLGFITRKQIVKKKGMPYFNKLKEIFPEISASDVLLIIFFFFAEVSDKILSEPVLFIYTALGFLFTI